MAKLVDRVLNSWTISRSESVFHCVSCQSSRSGKDLILPIGYSMDMRLSMLIHEVWGRAKATSIVWDPKKGEMVRT